MNILKCHMKTELKLKNKHRHLVTDRVRSTTGRLCFDTCLSIRLSVHTGGGGYPSQVQIGGGTPARSDGGYPSQVQTRGTLARSDGGTPARSSWGGYPPQIPPSDLAGGYPWWGWVTPPQVPPVRPGPGVPCQGVPHLRYPLSDLARVVPHLGYPPSDLVGWYPCWGGTPPQVRDGVLDTPRSVCLLRSRRRTFLFLGFNCLQFIQVNITNSVSVI